MSVGNRKVGILSTLTAPLLPQLIDQLYRGGVDDLVAILDQKLLGQKDVARFEQRTNGAFADFPKTLYDFASQGLEVRLVTSHNGADCLSLLGRLEPALLINGGTPRKLHADVIAAPKRGVINVHPGILPKYRGSSCVEWAVLNDDDVGNTAHFMTEEYDAGPILEIEPIETKDIRSYVELRVATYRASLPLMVRAVNNVLDSGISVEDLPQQPDGQAFKPISDDDMEKVVRKIADGHYRPGLQ